MSSTIPKVSPGGFENWFAIQGHCWAWPEGTREEWASFIMELERPVTYYRAGKRLAFSRRDDGRVFIYSPRNSSGPNDGVEITADFVPDFIVTTRDVII
jgi:hypothetical protein